jgi:hypothetical protein
MQRVPPFHVSKIKFGLPLRDGTIISAEEYRARYMSSEIKETINTSFEEKKKEEKNSNLANNVPKNLVHNLVVKPPWEAFRVHVNPQPMFIPPFLKPLVVETTPRSPIETTPIIDIEVKPTTPVETTPIIHVEVKPTTPVETTPIIHVEVKPTTPVETTPIETTPIIHVEVKHTTPVKPVEVAPASPIVIPRSVPGPEPPVVNPLPRSVPAPEVVNPIPLPSVRVESDISSVASSPIGPDDDFIDAGELKHLDLYAERYDPGADENYRIGRGPGDTVFLLLTHDKHVNKNTLLGHYETKIGKNKPREGGRWLTKLENGISVQYLNPKAMAIVNDYRGKFPMIAHETIDRYGRPYNHCHTLIGITNFQTTSRDFFTFPGIGRPHVRIIRKGMLSAVIAYIMKEDKDVEMISKTEGFAPKDVSFPEEKMKEEFHRGVWDGILGDNYDDDKIQFIYDKTGNCEWEKFIKEFRVYHDSRPIDCDEGLSLVSLNKQVNKEKIQFYNIGSGIQKYVFVLADAEPKKNSVKEKQFYKCVRSLMNGMTSTAGTQPGHTFDSMRVIVLTRWLPKMVEMNGKMIVDCPSAKGSFNVDQWRIGCIMDDGMKVDWQIATVPRKPCDPEDDIAKVFMNAHIGRVNAFPLPFPNNNL